MDEIVLPETYAPETTGLTGEEVAARVADGRTNAVRGLTSRTYTDILRENVFTLFNLILGVLFVAALVAGSPIDALFGLVIVLNSGIGVVQEIRAKRTLEHLSLLATPRARVIRDGAAAEIAHGEVVLDDVVELTAGDQVVADGVVLTTAGLEIDESLLTGESRPIAKQPGDEVLSGSFAAVGTARVRATRVGTDAYAQGIAAQARRFGLVRSELRFGVNRILRWVLWLMLPVGLVTLVGQSLTGAPGPAVTISLVAALVPMVPQGLVLLTSIALAVSIVRLGRRRALVQQLAAVEALARVDTLCIDKTGTLTTGELQVTAVESLNGGEEDLDRALGALAGIGGGGKVADALAARFSNGDWERTDAVAFSSARKWSAGTFERHGTWVMGATDVLLADPVSPARTRAATLAAEGQRVLLLARATAPLSAERPPVAVSPAALVLLQERIRPDAAATLQYFARQGVTVKVISGDDPRTAATIAHRAGLTPGRPLDARTLRLPAEDSAPAEEPLAGPTPADTALADAALAEATPLPSLAESELADAMEAHTVFGRVTPSQKREMVRALQARGHVVAMTGDGVNDVLALKEADLGVAMGSGAGAARAVAPVVLLDSRFNVLPHVVAEGRRVTGNIERVANLFVTKTVYAVLIALLVAAAARPYPFLPRHFTLIDALTIGIPAFILALAPSTERYLAGFAPRVLRFAIVAGTMCAAAAVGAFLVALRFEGTTPAEARTLATLALAILGLRVLWIVARPIGALEAGVLGVMAASLVAVFGIPLAREFFALPLPPAEAFANAAVIAVAAAVGLEAALALTRAWPRAVRG